MVERVRSYADQKLFELQHGMEPHRTEWLQRLSKIGLSVSEAARLPRFWWRR